MMANLPSFDSVMKGKKWEADLMDGSEPGRRGWQRQIGCRVRTSIKNPATTRTKAVGSGMADAP